jgi:hypothetical protein
MRQGLLFAAIIVLLGVGIAAAVWFFFLRDDDGASDEELEAYFVAVAPLINEIDDRDFEVTSAGETFLRYATFLADTRNDFVAIEPPGKAAAAHEELAASLNDATTALADLYDTNSDVATIEEATAILQEDPALVAAFGKAVAACTDLKTIAEESGVDVELDLCASAQPAADGS